MPPSCCVRRLGWAGGLPGPVALLGSAGEWPGPVLLSWPGLHVISGSGLCSVGLRVVALKGLLPGQLGFHGRGLRGRSLHSRGHTQPRLQAALNPLPYSASPTELWPPGPPFCLPASSLPGLDCGLRLCNQGDRDTLSSPCPPHLHPSLRLPLLRSTCHCLSPLSSSLVSSPIRPADR